jgi:cysteine synthase A
MATLLNNITEAVGNTPLVRLNRLTEGLPGQVAVKLEFYNPANSVKDRIGRSIVDAAEASGQLRPGGTIVEGTSGNTGIALAMVGAARGYKVILTMPETMSNERRVMLRAYGAEIVLTPGADGMRGALEKAQQIVAESDNAVWARQFANQANVQAHYTTTGPEVWEATDGQVDIFVAGIGTGGTITGAGRYLREQKPDVRLVAVEPADSPILSGGKPGPHKIQGLGANFIPEILDQEIYDAVYAATLEESVATARDLGTQRASWAASPPVPSCPRPSRRPRRRRTGTS